MNKAMEAALNEQIKLELHSAYTYLGMAAYCESTNLPGMAHWLELQAKEELEHAMKIYGHVNDRGGRVALKAIPEPVLDYASPLAVFEAVLAHEQKVTASIHKLYALAVEEKDYASLPLLQWFIEEQVEEESSADEVLQKIRLAGDSKSALLFLDSQLGSRE
ncbi:ferritin [Symbiobacterium thermophilum]|uniref:Ferritin n=1 Tax=Symbiobacterium thermophilum (strain DSM 24528 / JCM 14929 / IAM 14863 / T) TaxID=292459 RepID=Q67S14_SYMTH|nr:ferritin [Symbiobacterium thermophilum]BAD39529.1 ferritin [Symbiobacterium thermophilum IAM 14863]